LRSEVSGCEIWVAFCYGDPLPVRPQDGKDRTGQFLFVSEINYLPQARSMYNQAGNTGVPTMPVLSAMRFAATAGCVLGVGGCGTAVKVDAGQVRLDYQSSVADYRKCLAGFPNNPKACEGRRLIVETNERHIQQHDRQAVSDRTTALKSN
jgi:hypothetical protein